MKALCITGADNATLADVAAPFYQAGMQRPKALQRETQIDFTRWHQQVNGTLASGQPVGKLWENMATDLILANLDSECWGWFEAGSVEALEFWADLEPNIHFLLVCTRPELELTDKMAHTQPDAKAHQWLDQWHDRHQRMLNFYLKHPERCLLIDAEDAKAHLNGQLALAHEHWQLPLDAQLLENASEQIQEDVKETDKSHASSENRPGSQLASLIVRELINNSTKDITGLYNELQAAQYPFNIDADGQPASQRLMDWLKADIDAPMLQSLLSDFHRMHAAASQSQQLLQLQHEQSSETQRLTQALAQHQGEHLGLQQKLSTTEQTLTDAQQENELLLLQLHQVQEELESTFLAKQRLEQEAKQVKEPVSAPADTRRVTELEQALQKSQQQLGQVEHQATEAETRLQAATTQQQDAQQENELLLLQLHQVQEELEHYFLEHQKRQQDIAELQQKLERYKRQGTADFSTAQVSLADNGQLQWHLTDANLGGQEWPTLTITGQASFGKTELTVTGDGQPDPWVLNTQAGSSNLSNAQFAVAQDLPKTLKGALEHAPISPRQKKQWHKALDKLQQRLNQQPPRLLYNKVRLTREQVNPDYEHLWLTLEQPSFNSTNLQSWSFRLSCAGVTPNEFGNQPKLEVPEQDAQLLENWFQESSDHFGNKLELRYAMPGAMDMGVWKRLAAGDQRLLKTLIQQLPDILTDLEQQGRTLERPWADWQQLAAEMQRITRTKTAK